MRKQRINLVLSVNVMKIFNPFLALFCMLSIAFAQPPYNVGDWTSYRDFRYVRAVDCGSREAFFATSAGLLEYDLLKHAWRDPIAVGFGLSEPVELDDPILILYDENTGSVWMATRTQLLQYEVDLQRWRRVHRDLWPITQRVVNIGVGGDNLFIETVPEAFYAGFFPLGSPIPNDRWRGLVTRYKGSRAFGSLMLDIEPADPEGVRWRGLRSKKPLTKEELRGDPGGPPAGFPSLLLYGGWVWHNDGLLMDPYQRPIPITDWMVDQFGTLWATFWGAGIMEADLRFRATELHAFGPAGNDIRKIYLDRDDNWMAGFNNGERSGISRSDPEMKTWRFYERRDHSRIQSTDVFDITSWNGAVWFATEEGLLAFEKKGESWSRYAVQQNLQSNQIRALAATDSELWIGNSDGLSVMTLPGREIWRIDNGGIQLNGVTDLAVCGDTLYIGTYGGLFKGAVSQRRFSFTALDPGLLNAPVLEISVWNSEVWLATAEGVQVYNPQNGASKSWSATTWLNRAEPTCICAADSFVWVGTREQGFFRYRRATGEWLQYTTADGLLDNRVQVIRTDGDDLLIGTSSGLTRFYWNDPRRIR